jgi:hypothetical protein
VLGKYYLYPTFDPNILLFIAILSHQLTSQSIPIIQGKRHCSLFSMTFENDFELCLFCFVHLGLGFLPILGVVLEHVLNKTEDMAVELVELSHTSSGKSIVKYSGIL